MVQKWKLKSNNYQNYQELGDQIMEHVLAKTILISQAIELIAKKYKLSIEEARNQFYQSEVVKMLDDDETGLYGESALYLLSLFENITNERNKKTTTR